MDYVMSGMKKCKIRNWMEQSRDREDMEDIHYRDECPHWAVVPMKKKKNTM